MTQKWLEIRIAVPDQAVDLVSQCLTDIGCTGITAADKSLDTFVVPAPEDLNNDPILRAYFPYPEDLEALGRSVKTVLADLAKFYPELAKASLDIQGLDELDWESDWKQHFPPFKVGDRLVICPSWVDWQATGNETVITLDPGQAFGTGTHATTGLCLDAIAEHFDTTSPPQQILDVGTGSGILAMAAAVLGAQHVKACDIDSDACQVAIENVANNQLADAISITDTPLEEIPGLYDLVLANILASENIRLAVPLIEHLAPRGRLVLSGILIEQEQQVLDGFAKLPLTLLSTNHRDEWTCIVYQRE